MLITLTHRELGSIDGIGICGFPITGIGPLSDLAV